MRFFRVEKVPTVAGIRASPESLRVRLTRPDWQHRLSSDRDANAEIYVMNPVGTGLGRITRDPASDTNLVWSPDGQRIAYVRDNDQIFVMQADGTGAVNLTKNSAIDGSPTVSDPS